MLQCTTETLNNKGKPSRIQSARQMTKFKRLSTCTVTEATIEIHPMTLKENIETDSPMLLTIQQTAEFLNVSRSTVYKMIKQGKLHPIRPVSDAPRIIRAQLIQYVRVHILKI